MYTLGVGVTKNYSKAFAWTKKAAEQGFVEAQYELGSMYSEGVVVTKNYSKAVYWYKKAAEQGHPDAHAMLGAMYYSGQVSKSYSNSYVYLLIAQVLGAKQEGISFLITELENNHLSKEEMINAQKIAEEKFIKIQSKK